jgi:hypothetical protein
MAGFLPSIHFHPSHSVFKILLFYTTPGESLAFSGYSGSLCLELEFKFSGILSCLDCVSIYPLFTSSSFVDALFGFGFCFHSSSSSFCVVLTFLNFDFKVFISFFPPTVS